MKCAYLGEILLLNTNFSANTNAAQLLAQIIFFIFAFIFVAALAFFSTRWVAAAKMVKQGGCNVRIIERAYVGQHSSILLVKAGGKYVLIGVTKEHVSFLAEVDKEDIALENTDVSFKNIFSQLLGKQEFAECTYTDNEIKENEFKDVE